MVGGICYFMVLHMECPTNNCDPATRSHWRCKYNVCHFRHYYHHQQWCHHGHFRDIDKELYQWRRCALSDSSPSIHNQRWWRLHDGVFDRDLDWYCRRWGRRSFSDVDLFRRYELSDRGQWNFRYRHSRLRCPDGLRWNCYV